MMDGASKEELDRHRVIIELRADNDRLRGLVKDAEGIDDRCYWCGARTLPDGEGSAVEPHGDDCEAFLHDGSVR